MADFQANFQPVQQNNPFQTMATEQQLGQARQIAQNEFARFQAQLAFEQAKQDWYEHNYGAALTKQAGAEAFKTTQEGGQVVPLANSEIALRQRQGELMHAQAVNLPVESRLQLMGHIMQSGLPGAAFPQFMGMVDPSQVSGAPSSASAGALPPQAMPGNPDLFGPGALFGAGAGQAIAGAPPQVSAINPLSGVGAQGPATAAMLPQPPQTAAQPQGAPQGQPGAVAPQQSGLATALQGIPGMEGVSALFNPPIGPDGKPDYTRMPTPTMMSNLLFHMMLGSSRLTQAEVAVDKAKDYHLRTLQQGQRILDSYDLGKEGLKLRERSLDIRQWLNQQTVAIRKQANVIAGRRADIAGRRADIAQQNADTMRATVSQGGKLLGDLQQDLTKYQLAKEKAMSDAAESQKVLASINYNPNDPGWEILHPQEAKTYQTHLGQVDGSRVAIGQIDGYIRATRAQMGQIQAAMMQPGGRSASTPAGTTSTQATAAAARAATPPTPPRQRPPAQSPGQAIGARFLQRALQHR